MSSVLTAKQFAWTYVIINGCAGVAPSYYGGTDVIDTRVSHLVKNYWSSEGFDDIRNQYLHEIKTYGVNWDQTNEPVSDQVYRFAGTECPSDIIEVFKGELVLNNGLKQNWYSDPLPASDAFTLMAEVDRLQQEFQHIFG